MREYLFVNKKNSGNQPEFIHQSKNEQLSRYIGTVVLQK
ncbi:hypothetical protein P278_20390 [Zhouia amylolytica AD3]|uniref:Uncharacterized protein n=1 Tax=Zhouia amylolytica AD3 TaxID=1286632 RepID=W2UN34_9FLAO|nr:hypothetical protein P278_20390 [Zhouia amylolytica AD3]